MPDTPLLLEKFNFSGECPVCHNQIEKFDLKISQSSEKLPSPIFGIFCPSCGGRDLPSDHQKSSSHDIPVITLCVTPGGEYYCPRHPRVTSNGPGVCPIDHQPLIKSESDFI